MNPSEKKLADLEWAGDHKTRGNTICVHGCLSVHSEDIRRNAKAIVENCENKCGLPKRHSAMCVDVSEEYKCDRCRWLKEWAGV